MLPFDKDTMMMVALLAVIIASIYMYRELQTVKKDIRNKPSVIFSPPPRPVQRQVVEVEPVEIKTEHIVADEQ